MMSDEQRRRSAFNFNSPPGTVVIIFFFIQLLFCQSAHMAAFKKETREQKILREEMVKAENKMCIDCGEKVLS